MTKEKGGGVDRVGSIGWGSYWKERREGKLCAGKKEPKLTNLTKQVFMNKRSFNK